MSLFQPFGLAKRLFLPGLLDGIRGIKFGIGKDKAHAPTGNRGGLKVCGFKGKGSGKGGAVAAHPESMNSKQANAKALGGVFHKGAFMKWVGVLIVGLFIPMVESAASNNMKQDGEIFDISTMPMHSYILDGTIQTKSGPVRLLKFHLLPLRDLPNIRTQIRLYFDKDLVPGEDPTAQCYIKIKKHGTFPLRDYLILTGHGPEVWFSYLTDRQLAEVFIIWQPGAPELQLAQSEVESYPFQRKKGWITKENWNSMRRVKVKDRPAYFREVLLDDVCVKPSPDDRFPFSETELKTFQFFK